jgi:DNA-binding transcriptional LysR family regulator
MRETPAGSIRISTSAHAASNVLWPVLEKLLSRYPDIQVELNIESRLTDIVAERYDAGVRLGEQLAKDMVAVRIGPDLRMAVVAAPCYLAARSIPRTPQDLAEHRCINLRQQTLGGLYAWELERNRREVKVRVEDQFIFNDVGMILQAAAAGFGLACVLEDHVAADLAAGRLERVLEDWCPPFPGYHLYYPSRRQPSAAFALLVEALRYRE